MNCYIKRINLSVVVFPTVYILYLYANILLDIWYGTKKKKIETKETLTWPSFFFNSDGMLFFPFNIELISLWCQVGTVILMHTNTFLSCNLN